MLIRFFMKGDATERYRVEGNLPVPQIGGEVFLPDDVNIYTVENVFYSYPTEEYDRMMVEVTLERKQFEEEWSDAD